MEVVRLMTAMVGQWKNTATSNLEPYLKSIGVSWAKRKVALAFKPELSFALVDGVLQVAMPAPHNHARPRRNAYVHVPCP